MNLNLDLNELNRPKLGFAPDNPYVSPIGWWAVTTEGDCEGRSTDQLGTHFGHVAEIAFHLADKVVYKLTFSPVKNRPVPPAIRPTYVAKKTGVWIGLGVDSDTWGMSPECRASWFSRWLDVTEPKIECKGSTTTATYYAGCYLELVTPTRRTVGKGVEKY